MHALVAGVSVVKLYQTCVGIVAVGEEKMLTFGSIRIPDLIFFWVQRSKINASSESPLQFNSLQTLATQSFIQLFNIFRKLLSTFSTIESISLK